MWVVGEDSKIYAYSMADQAHIPGQDFTTLDPLLTYPYDIWSDGETMWVFNPSGHSLLAYDLSTKARELDRDITLGRSLEFSPSFPANIWSDGDSLWVSDVDSDKLKVYAYNLSDGAYRPGKDFDYVDDSGPHAPLWSDGETLWVGNVGSVTIRAFNMETRQRDRSKDFTVPGDVGNGTISGIWSDGQTMFAADNDAKIYTYNMPKSSNTALTGLTIGGRGVTAFRKDHYDYQHGIAHDTEQVTIEPETLQDFATVAYSVADADDTQDGHQIDLSEGRNALTITVTAQNGTDTQDYTISVNRGTDADFGWQPEKDFDNAFDPAGNDYPASIWSDGTTMWVADRETDVKLIYAYDMDTKERVPGRDLTVDEDNDAHSIWSDRTTMWMSDPSDRKIYAYNLYTNTRDPSKDFTSQDLADNDHVDEIGSDGTTLWVESKLTLTKPYVVNAYDLYTKERRPDRDLRTIDISGAIASMFWTDGTTMWHGTSSGRFIRSIRIHDRSEDTSRDFSTDHSSSKGMWSDGETIWIADDSDQKIYAYRMPAASDTSIGVLTVNGEDVAGLHPEEIDHQHGVASTITQATVLAKPTNRFAELEFDGTDADPNTDGFQINLSDVRNRLTDGFQINLSDVRNRLNFNIDAANRDRGRHALSINQGVSADFGWRAVDDLDGVMSVAGNDDPAALWSDGTTFWVSDTRDAPIYAYDVESMTRDPDKDFPELDQDNGQPRGMSSDGTTMWVVDIADKKLYAYDMDTKARDSDKDFNTLETAGNERPRGAWTDGTTMWVSESQINDSPNNKLYAYNVATKAPDSDKDFNTLASAGNTDPYSMWSDGVTMWVSDSSDRKIYAYNMETKAPDPAKDFNTLNAADNDFPWGMWSNRSVMWVVDYTDSKLYSYNMDRPAPNNLAAEPGSRAIRLTWDDPSNATIVKYQFRAIPNTDPSMAEPWFDIPASGPSTTSVSYVSRSLTNGREHAFQVRAIYSRDGSEVEGNHA